MWLLGGITMQTPRELRDLATYHRGVAEHAPEESQVWRMNVADYLDTLADAVERSENATDDKPAGFAS